MSGKDYLAHPPKGSVSGEKLEKGVVEKYPGGKGLAVSILYHRRIPDIHPYDPYSMLILIKRAKALKQDQDIEKVKNPCAFDYIVIRSP